MPVVDVWLQSTEVRHRTTSDNSIVDNNAPRSQILFLQRDVRSMANLPAVNSRANAFTFCSLRKRRNERSNRAIRISYLESMNVDSWGASVVQQIIKSQAVYIR